MVTPAELLKCLPPPQNIKEVVTWGQSVKNIKNEIIDTHERYETEYDSIFEFFDTGDIVETSKGLFNFCKKNIPYEVESSEDQTVKSPTIILSPGETGDCKHYSLFIGGILDAVKHQGSGNGDWDWTYRFASYHKDKQIEHVFVVVFDDYGEVWVDPVLGYFNERKIPTRYEDKQPKYNEMLSRISGIGSAGTTVQVNKADAETNFLVLVNLNVFGLKDMLKNNMSITNGAFRDYYIANGFDFIHLMRIVNA